MKYDYLQGMDGDGRMILPFLHNPADDERLIYVHVFRGEIEGSDSALATAEGAYLRHNRDDRPRGREIRSLSMGDVVVVHAPDGPKVLLCVTVGFAEIVDEDARERLLSIAERRAFGPVAAATIAEAGAEASI